MQQGGLEFNMHAIRNGLSIALHNLTVSVPVSGPSVLDMPMLLAPRHVHAGPATLRVGKHQDPPARPILAQTGVSGPWRTVGKKGRYEGNGADFRYKRAPQGGLWVEGGKGFGHMVGSMWPQQLPRKSMSI